MSLETSVEGSPEWISRIAHSASGLARNLVSNGIGFESTGELAALRSAQKIAYQSHSHDALLSTADRLPRLLSNRYRANATFRSSERSPEALSDAELEDEIAEFLQKKCAINGESSAESSRSASPQYGGKERNDSVMAGSSKTQLSELDNDHSGFLKGYSYATDEKDEQWFSSPKMGKVPVVNETLASLTNQNYPQKQWSKAVRQSVTNTLAERELAHFDTHEYIPRTNLDDETVSASRQQQREHLKQQAAQRLLLISKHLDIPKMLNPPPTSSSFSGQASDTARTAYSAAPIFESSYNQLCYSDDSTAQEWAAYQAEGSFCLQQDLLVQQQRLDAYGATVMQQVTHQAHEAQQQSHMSTSAIEKDFPEKSTPLEPKETTTHAPPTRTKGHEQEKQEDERIDFTFHCPWVQCHEVRITN